MYNVYNSHQGFTRLPQMAELDQVRQLAEAAAQLGHDCLYRAFEVCHDERTKAVIGERFVKAWSVLGGKVTERNEPTIPAEHW